MLNHDTLGIIARFISLADLPAFCLVNSEWNLTIELHEDYSVFWVEKQINFLESKISLYETSIEYSKDQAPTITNECPSNGLFFFGIQTYTYKYGHTWAPQGMKHPKFFHHRLQKRIHTLESKIYSLKKYKTYGYEGFSREHLMNIVYYEYYWLASNLNSYLAKSTALPHYIGALCEDLERLELERCLLNNTEDSVQLALVYLIKLFKTPPPPIYFKDDVYRKYINTILETKPIGRIIISTFNVLLL